MTGRRLRIQGPRALFVLLLTAMLSCVAMIGPVRAQPAPPVSTLPADWQFGYHLFQLLLEQKGLTSISSFDEVFSHTPSDTVMVLVGDLSWVDNSDWSDIQLFLRNGGAVLVATDRSANAPGLFNIKGGPIEVSDQRDAYQGFLDCPRIRDLDRSHDLSKNLDQLIGNRSGRISTTRGRNGSWTNVAYLPRYHGGSSGGTKSPVIATMRFNDSRRGRLMVAADHSLFINGMLWHGNNAILALNTTDWLCSDHRRTLLFLSDGVVVRSGIPLPPTPPTPIPPVLPEDIPPFSLEDLAETPPESIITFANAFITGLEDENVFNQVLANHASDMPRPELYQQLYLTVAFLAAFWVIRQLLQRGRRFESPASRPVVEAASTRVDDLVNSNDLQRPLRELARDLFRRLTGSDDPKDWSVWPKSLKVSGLHPLEKIATNVDRRPVSKRQFRRMVKQIERIRHLHEQGQLTHPRIHSNKIEDLSGITRYQ